MFGATRNEIMRTPGAVWLLLFGTLVNRFGSFVLVFLVLYLTRNGYTITQAGVAVSAYGIGGLGSALAGGYLTDRIGRRRTIGLSMFSAAAVMVALSQTTALVPVVVLACLAGLTCELYRPASSAYLTDLTKTGERVTAFALYRLAINLGAAIGPAVGGFVAEHSFTLLFLGDALTSVIFGVVAVFFLPSTVHTRQAESAPAAAGSVRQILADRNFMLFLVGATIAALVYFQAYSTFPLQVTAYGFSSAVYGMLIGLNGLLVILIELPFSSVTRRFDMRRVMATGMLLIGVGFFIVGLGASITLLIAAVVVFTFGEIVHAPVAGAFVADLAPPALRGRYMGAFGVGFGVALVFGPGLGTAVLQHSSGALWTGCFVLGVISAILMLSIRRTEPAVAAEAAD
jgi:MFS family permease